MLSTESLRRIDLEVAKYPASQKQSAVMSALAIAQDEHGWLSVGLMDEVARHLGMPPVAVYETGRFKLTICTNLPCALQGANVAAEHLKSRLGVDFNGTTADGRFTLKEGECFGACGDAPVVLVNNKRMCSWMQPAKLDELIAELSAAADRGEGAPAGESEAHAR
jgi:NADH-quinone oxidoreductase subunit E